MGFSQTLGESGDDLGRKNDLMVGYFCHDNGGAMSAQAAEEMIGQIGFAGHT